jgi:hypothetical protein
VIRSDPVRPLSRPANPSRRCPIEKTVPNSDCSRLALCPPFFVTIANRLWIAALNCGYSAVIDSLGLHDSAR